MLSDMFHLSVSPIDLILRTIAVYVVVLFLMRIAGRKQIAQMGPTGLVAMLLITNAVQNSMNAGDSSLLGGLISALTLVVLSRIVGYATFHSHAMSALIEGKPIMLVKDGEVQRRELQKILLTLPQFRALLMMQGIDDVKDLYRVIMDGQGQLIVIKQKPDVKRHSDEEVTI